MNGKLAINIDEEALFEVLVAANFAAPETQLTASVPADVTRSTAEPSWIFHRLPARQNYEAGASTSYRF